MFVKDSNILAACASFESSGDRGNLPCFVIASWVLLGRQTVGPLSILVTSVRNPSWSDLR